ncbi:MAG: hypothetical protein CMP21_08920 [Rickettsiales bacterium]|nr:hypothetical protein [Rickettsiales bacterium]|tara:strand:+ start:3443 stop:3841 length:399 start_codon:yes stop_codon:yes gene_type:complete
MNILNDILNDKNINNKLKKVMKGEPMSNMGEFARKQDEMYDGTEGYSDKDIDQAMEMSRSKYMGTVVLKKVRVELGLNQQQMADVLGYTRQDIISGIENGTRTMSGVAMRCLEYLIQIEKLKFVLKKEQGTL